MRAGFFNLFRFAAPNMTKQDENDTLISETSICCPRFVPSLVFKIDSKAVSVKLNVNPNPKGDLTKNYTSCMLDPDEMKYDPIRIRFYHYDNQTSLRKLLWHEDELRTNVILISITNLNSQKKN
jgi:hypothetical protein